MYQSFEARNIPDVQECVRQHADRKKDVWGLHEILNTFAMHPEGDDHSNKECHNIDLRVQLVLGAVLVELCDKVYIIFYAATYQHQVKFCKNFLVKL